jgi:hypothetical protein
MDISGTSAPPAKSSESQSRAPARVRGLLLPATRLIWIILALATLGLFIYSLSVFAGQHDSLTPFVQLTEWTRADLAAAMDELGFSTALLTGLFIALDVVGYLTYSAVGFLIFWKKSDEWIGWYSSLLLVLFGWINLYGVTLWLQSSAPMEYEVINNTLWSGFFIFLYIFPDGRFVPRWTAVVAAIYVAWTLAAFFLPLPDWDEGIGMVLTLATLGAAAYGQVYRYRSVSDASQRQQTKWLVFAVVGMFAVSILILAVIPTFFPSLSQTGPLGLVNALLLQYAFMSLLLLSIPLAIGAAILRYRLWDIDVVVNRALIYGTLTTILAAIFAGSVALMNQIAGEILGERSTALAATVSAILVASIFQPLRARVGNWINRRFYPQKLELAKEFYEFEPHMVGLISTSELLQVAVQRVSDLMRSKFGAIFLDDGTGIFNVSQTHSITRSQVDPISLGQDELGEIIKPRVISYAEESDFDLLVPLYVPRIGTSQLVGVLGLGPRGEGLGYSTDDMKSLATIGGMAGKAIYAAQLNERMRAR